MVPARRVHLPLLVLIVTGVLLASMLPANAATSRSLSVKVSTGTPIVGSAIRISGTLSKSPKGAPVTVQRLSGGRWVTAKATRTTNARGAWSVRTAVSSNPGAQKLRAVAKAIRSRKPAASPVVTLDVRRSVTITASATPSRVTVGDPVTVHGAATPFVPGTKVTIRTGQGTQITTTTIERDGSYTATVTPSAPGTSTYRAVVAGRTGYATATSSTISVSAEPVPSAPVITTTRLPTTSRGAIWDLQLGSTEPGTWSLVRGSLQPGLTLERDGRITGTVGPGAEGTSVAVVEVQGRRSGLRSTEELLRLTVDRQVVATALPNGVVGRYYSFPLGLRGDVPGRWQTSGLPDGLSLDASGVLSGHPTTRSSGQTLAVRYVTDDPAVQEPEVILPFATESSEPAETMVAAGSEFACRVLATTSTLWCWGFNLRGNVGVGERYLGERRVPEPTQVDSSAWRQVFTGSSYTACGTRTDDSLWCWGANGQGQVGDGTTTDADAPVRVAAERSWSTASVGETHACGIDRAGSLWCWGSAAVNALGGAVATDAALAPSLVDAEHVWTAVSAGAGVSCGLHADRTLWCWGDRMGNRPAQVGTDRWLTVETGYGTVCAIRTDDVLRCFGDNRDGQVGDGSDTYRARPTTVAGGLRWRAVSSGGDRRPGTCGVATNGTAWCWGSGPTGNEDGGTSFVPVQVGSSSDWVSISVGDDAVCGVVTDGSQRCWGAGGGGQLGHGHPMPSQTPVTVR